MSNFHEQSQPSVDDFIHKLSSLIVQPISQILVFLCLLKL